MLESIANGYALMNHEISLKLKCCAAIAHILHASAELIVILESQTSMLN